ncbi:MFS transporter, partial [Pelagibacterium lacus]
SFQYVTLISGQLVALLVLLVLQSILSETALDAWGWRIPFLIGGVLAVIVFWLRRRLAETESFEKRGGGQSSMFALFRHHPREVGLVILLTAGGTLAFYAYSIYLQKFLVNTSGFDRATASQINAAALFGFMLIQPLAGALSDRIGRKPLMIGFGVLGVLLTWPIFTTLESVHSPMLAFLIMLGALAIVTGYTS